MNKEFIKNVYLNIRNNYDLMLEDIKKAKHHIHLEYFNFRNDSIANLTFEILGQKAKEGVEVRAIFDAFGNFSNNRPLKKKHLKTQCPSLQILL